MDGVNNRTLVCIVRHGETDWNLDGRLQGREDIELNENGRQQAHDLAEWFKKNRWDVVVSSPLKRAFETSGIIAQNIGIAPVFVIEEWIERDYGSGAGLLPDERRIKFPDGIPDQEEFEILRQRAMLALEKTVKQFAGKRIIVVAHGGITNSVLYTLSNGEFGSFKTRLKNACINQLKLIDNRWNIDFYNKTIDEIKTN